MVRNHAASLVLTTLADRMEMAHSVEGRVPFLDHHVAEYAAGLPLKHKIRMEPGQPLREKNVLREAVRDYVLPEAVMRLIEARGYRVDPADMDDAAMVKTLIHEAGHILLHESPPGMFLPRSRKEVEAESVAFVVAAAHGMSTDQYSFQGAEPPTSPRPLPLPLSG